MDDVLDKIKSCIEELRIEFDKYRNEKLNEETTKYIFVNPLLESLGWDVRNLYEVQVEYPTIDGKSVDYALKIDENPVLFIEAKPLNNSLTDVKAITQVVSYAVNAGVEWCILTNGIQYRIYKSTKNAEAPEKLLYETSIDEEDTEGMSLEQVAKKFELFSRNSMDDELLYNFYWDVYIKDKTKEALKILIMDPPSYLIRKIREVINDDNIKPQQIKRALKRVWAQTVDEDVKLDKTDFIEKDKAKKKKKPPKEIDKISIDGEFYSINYSYDILVNTAEFLVKEGKIKRYDCPIDITRGKRYLIHKEPIHSDGVKFFAPKELSNGLFIEVHLSTDNTINHAKSLLEKYGYDKEILKIYE
jgi:hypothetical protein